MWGVIELATLGITLGSAVLGAFALRSGKTRSARWLGSFFLWLSSLYAGEMLPLEAYELPIVWALTFAGILGLTLSFFGFIFSTFESWKPIPQTQFRLAWALGFLVYALGAVAALGGPGLPLFQGPDPRPPWVWKITDLFGLAGDVALILLAIMHATFVRHAAPEKTQGVRSLSLLAVGFAFLIGGAPAFIPQIFDRFNPPWSFFQAGRYTILVLVTCLSWLYATRGHHRRLAWQTFAAILAVFTVGSVLSVYSPQIAYMPLRILGLSLIFVAMLRGQIPGLDRTLRFTISKTTIAAIFVAVFFVASEGAQAFFGERFQNEYFGIAAAGLLVFAISPVMRLADRLANSAVPATGKSNGASIFESAVKAALADGKISATEEIHLAEVAEKLGLSNTEAARIRHQITD